MSKDDFNRSARRLKLIQSILEKARERGDEDKVRTLIERMEAVRQQELSPEEEAILEDARIAEEVGESRVIRAFNIVAAMEGRNDRLMDNAAEEKRQELGGGDTGPTVTLEP